MGYNLRAASPIKSNVEPTSSAAVCINVRSLMVKSKLILVSLIILSALLIGCRSDEAAEEIGEATLEIDKPLIQLAPTTAVASETPRFESIQAESPATETRYPDQSNENTVNLPLAQSGNLSSTSVPASDDGSDPTVDSNPQGIETEESPLTTTEPIEPTDTPTPSYPVHQGAPLNRDNIGIQIHLHREDLDWLMAHLNTLDVGWVKVQVSWKIYQPDPDRLDEARFGELDRLITAANDSDIKVLLSVAKAPEWSRPTTELDGPPADYAHFESFMGILASRYQGQVDAYELWNEPNLRREWNGYPLSAADLVQLIAAGARGVRAADPNALVISAAPATTGINDGISAIDDRVYLQQMISAGVTDLVDAMSAHPYGWANPPDSSFGDPDPAVPSHNNHPSFFFLDTMNDYRAILDQSGNGHMPIWVTEFGWGTFDGLDAAPPDEVAFMADVDERQQAEYILRGFELANQMPGVGPQFLWNLNFAPRLGSDFAVSGFSLLRSDGSVRPAYQAMTTISKGE
jgi:hypothetical protein